MRKKQSGFTLIELVVVITILAIMIAVALPRFANLQAQARIAKMQGAMGSIRSAATMSHALLLANGYATNYTGDPGVTAPVGVDVNVEGVNVTYQLGYPDSTTIASLAGIGGAGAVTQGMAAADVGDYRVISATGTTLTLAPDANHPACTITYVEATAASVTPTFGVANLTVANCD